MFQTVFPSIIRSSRLYIQQQAYVKQVLWLFAGKQALYIQQQVYVKQVLLPACQQAATEPV
jgi:hypothetical protein